MNRWRGEVGAALIVIAVVGILLFGYIEFPNGLVPDWGFGPDWECSFHPDSEPICFKKHSAQTDNSN